MLNINTNTLSLYTQRSLNKSQNSLAISLQRLSSGLRVNSAKDDAAGLAIGERMTSQIRGMNVATRNANDGISLLQTAEGTLQSSGDMLQRIRELAVQSANATNSISDRQAMNGEANQLVAELDRIGRTSSFNGIKLFDGSFTEQSFQIGANPNETVLISLGAATADRLGIHTGGSSSSDGASVATTLPSVLTGSDYASTAAGFSAQTISISDASGVSHPFPVAPGDSARKIADGINTGLSPVVTATATNSATIDLSATTGIQDGDTVSFKLVAGGVTTSISFTRDSSTFPALEADFTHAINSASPPNLSATANTGNVTVTAANGENIGLVDFAVADSSSLMSNPSIALNFSGTSFARVTTDGTLFFDRSPTWDTAGGDTLSIDIKLQRNDGSFENKTFTSANTATSLEDALYDLAAQIGANVFQLSDGTTAKFQTVGVLVSDPWYSSVAQIVFYTGSNFTFSASNLNMTDATGGDLAPIIAQAAPFGTTQVSGDLILNGEPSLVAGGTNETAIFMGDNAGKLSLVTDGGTNSTISFNLEGVDVTDGAAVAAAIVASGTATGPWTLSGTGNDVQFTFNGATSKVTLQTGRQIINRDQVVYDISGTGALVTGPGGALHTSGNSTFLFNGTDSEIYDAPASSSSSSIIFGGKTLTEGTGNDSAVQMGTVSINLPTGYSVSSDATAGNLFGSSQTNQFEDVSSINISTSEGATRALGIVDGALATINGIRADTGAYQNRFQS